MITETGRVVARSGNRAWIETQLQAAACSACSLRGACGQAVLSRLSKGPRHLVLDSAVDLAVNDQVEVGISESGLLVAAMTAYLMPVLLLLAFAVLGESWAGETAAIVFGLLGLGCGLLLARLLERSLVARWARPTLMRVLANQ